MGFGSNHLRKWRVFDAVKQWFQRTVKVPSSEYLQGGAAVFGL
ncbi:versicolorin reductase [Pyrenophora tritici-repentis Pt-1C-BFP]|uniref:Versicolorin reductase n=1 Tax=Pyrenophora tritici-repentis (strain Pt-1C-BFP) TaxID=426418 RepID=B2W8H4_PYRTR|nr:versicolorin reductase [Pyrenophora tritici-repentis Pt-1C-BFP]EDU49202.1 versicolorin reductase [Pyrenophora tritici-repentis Pt-1C-BFP]